MTYFQKQFFRYLDGIPSIHTLNVCKSNIKEKYLTITTTTSIAILWHNSIQYKFTELTLRPHVNQKSNKKKLNASLLPIEIFCSTIVHNENDTYVAIAYATGEPMNTSKISNTEHKQMEIKNPILRLDLMKINNLESENRLEHTDLQASFELDGIPYQIYGVQVKSEDETVTFSGFLVFYEKVIAAYGYITEDRKEEGGSNVIKKEFSQLTKDQFKLLFQDIADFSHPVLAVDLILTPSGHDGWLVFGCKDGLVRVYQMAVKTDGQNKYLCGPFLSRDFQIAAPITSVALFFDYKESNMTTNLLTTSAVGYALILHDIGAKNFSSDPSNCASMFSHCLSQKLEAKQSTCNSLFSATAADINLNGKMELILGTDDRAVLAYEQKDEGVNTSKTWMLMSKKHWDVQTFGAVYGLQSWDINNDGIPELIIACSTGVLIYEADPKAVLAIILEVVKQEDKA